jgi:hypothetical protein
MTPSAIVIALPILGNCIYFIVRIRQNKTIEPSTKNEELSRESTAILSGAAIGFLAASGAMWAYLTATGRFVVLGNQYAGPPGIMTCMVFGLFGLIPGSIVGMAFGKKRKYRRKAA